MSKILNNTMGTTKDAMASVKEGAEHAVASVKEGAEHAASSARVTWLDGVKAVTGVVALVRGLGLDDGLGWLGLARRRSPLVPFAMFGAGVAVGAGASLLFAPMSGADLRRTILRQLKGVQHEAKDALHRAESQVEDKAEELSGKAKGAANKVERKVAEKVDQGAEAVNQKVDAAAEAVKDTVEDARAMLTPTGIFPASPAKDEPSNPARSYTGPGNGHRFD